MTATVPLREPLDKRRSEVDLREVLRTRVLRSPGGWISRRRRRSRERTSRTSASLRRTDVAKVFVAIDNLVKGAAGQAIQAMNIMFGLPEPTGLKMTRSLSVTTADAAVVGLGRAADLHALADHRRARRGLDGVGRIGEELSRPVRGPRGRVDGPLPSRVVAGDHRSGERASLLFQRRGASGSQRAPRLRSPRKRQRRSRRSSSSTPERRRTRTRCDWRAGRPDAWTSSRSTAGFTAAPRTRSRRRDSRNTASSAVPTCRDTESCRSAISRRRSERSTRRSQPSCSSRSRVSPESSSRRPATFEDCGGSATGAARS